MARAERARPRAGELIAAAGGVLLLVALLLPWYGRETDIAGAVISESWTAWQTTPGRSPSLLFAIAAVAVAVPGARLLRTAPTSFRADRSAGQCSARSGLLLVVFRAVHMPIPDIDLVQGDHADSSRGPGLFLALLATRGHRVRGPARCARRPPLATTRSAARAAGPAATPAAPAAPRPARRPRRPRANAIREPTGTENARPWSLSAW